MFGFKKAVAGVAKEEFECECCGTLDGQAPTGCGCGTPTNVQVPTGCGCGAPTNSQASAGCGCGPIPAGITSSCDSCGTPSEKAKTATDSTCKSSCSEEK